MELAVASGLKVLTTMLEEDRTAICGPHIRPSVTPRGPARCRVRSCSAVGRLRCAARVCGRTVRR
jgi:hypothetical protein